MAMRHRAATEFWHQYNALPQAIRERADKQFALMNLNAQHPSPQLKKIGDRFGNEIWSARVTLSYRALAIKRPDGFLWFWIGNHQDYELLIK